MADKITMHFEQLSDDDSSLLSIEAPISIYKVVEDIDQLYGLTAIEGDPYYNVIYFDPEFPECPRNNDNLYDYENAPSVTVFVKNVTGYDESIRRRGAYFRYNYTNGNWQEIALGTHSHENKELLDRMSAGEIGSWFNLANYPTAENPLAIIGTEQPSMPFDNQLFFNTDINKLFKYVYSTVTWIEIPVVIATEAPVHPLVKDMFFNSETEELFIFVGAKAGEKRMLVLELTDPDNNDMTYSYDVTWRTIPDSIPNVPEDEEDTQKLYLGVDSDGTPQWKDSLIAGQTFEMKQITITNAHTNDVSIEGIKYNPETDEVLVMDDNLFLANRDISYDDITETMSIHANEGTDANPIFMVGEKVTVLVIRNGASAVLDQLATDYVTKAEAVNLLSGGMIRLKGYATTSDLQERALREHTHSQFSRVGHDHDFRYANYNHTHDNYLTRAKVLELIEETLELHPSILSVLQGFSDYLTDINTNPELTALLSTMATQSNIAEIQEQIDAINENFYNKEQLYAYLRNEARLRADQIDTHFLTETFTQKSLEEVLDEFKEKLDTDLAIVNSTNVILEDTIDIKLGEDGSVGSFNDGNSVLSGTSLHTILEQLLQKRVVPTYEKAELITEFNVTSYPEIGADVPINISSIYEIHDSGALTFYRVMKEENDSSIPLFESDEIGDVNESITIGTQPVTLSVYASFATGPVKYDNFGDEVPGKILAGTTEISTFEIQPQRALFYGGSAEILDKDSLDSDSIRDNFLIKVFPDYSELELEVEIIPGTRTIVFALPASAGLLSAIEHREEGYSNILPVFSLRTVDIEGANGISPIAYNVYIYNTPFALEHSMYLKFIK